VVVLALAPIQQQDHQHNSSAAAPNVKLAPVDLDVREGGLGGMAVGTAVRRKPLATAAGVRRGRAPCSLGRASVEYEVEWERVDQADAQKYVAQSTQGVGGCGGGRARCGARMRAHEQARLRRRCQPTEA
jgi:hypothetical protein